MEWTKKTSGGDFKKYFSKGDYPKVRTGRNRGDFIHIKDLATYICLSIAKIMFT